MGKIKWLQSFETGIPDIDSDHRQLVEAIRKIEDALETGAIEACSALFREFLDSAAEHFKHEEAFLISINFPRVESHSAAHKRLLEMAHENLLNVEKSDDPEEAHKCLEEMIYFLLEDVIKADAEFKSYAQEKGQI